MPRLIIGGLAFTFPNGWTASVYDEWRFYRRDFIGICIGTRAVDILVLPPNGDCLWLVEVKDYRTHPREKPGGFAEVIAQKTRDTLAGLAAARLRADLPREQRVAHQALRCNRIRVIFHLETPTAGPDVGMWLTVRGNVQNKMRTLLGSVDPDAQVVSMSRTTQLPWTVGPV